MTLKNLSFTYILLVLVFVNPSCKNQPTKNSEVKEKSSFENVLVEGSGMDSAKLAEIPVIMQQFVNDRKISGAVTLVAHNGHVVSFNAVGYQNIKKNEPMQKNSIFRIASMTKPFVAAAIMMLVEEGKLQLDDPVEKYLPQYRNMWLIAEKSDEKETLIRPGRLITVRDLLTHTHGLADLPGRLPVKSVAEFTLVISQLPLQFDMGSKWQYGGSGINTAALIVEVLSGKSYEEFLAERIFKPLGMENTAFSVPEDRLDRLVSLYKPSDSLGIDEVEAPNWWIFPRPDAGLYSTAMDMAKWMQTLLNKGAFNGIRILSEQSVEEMTKIQIGDLEAGFTPGMSFGLAVGIVSHPVGVTAMLSQGTFGHGGAFGTQSWADPKTNTAYILMIQRTNFGNSDASEIRNRFQEIASEAIVK